MTKRKRFQSGSEILNRFVPNFDKEEPGLERLSEIESDRLIKSFSSTLHKELEKKPNTNRKQPAK